MRIVLFIVLALIASFATGLVQAATHAPPTRHSSLTHVECGTAQRSLGSETSLHLVFANHTHGAVSIYWLDFKGERVWYATLAPGESYSQQTYVTHPWVIVDANGTCLEQLVATQAGTFDVPIGIR